jgi:SAM-dependent methyltransferase
MSHTSHKKQIIESMDRLATLRDFWIKKNSYYYQELFSLFTFIIPKKSAVLEIGCGTGNLLNHLFSAKGVGVDISKQMIEIGKKKYPEIKFLQMDAENISIKQKFDYIILSDSLVYFEDVQKLFLNLKNNCTSKTRLVINYHNYLWMPILNLAEKIGLKMPSKNINWLNFSDISNFLYLSGFEIVKKGERFIFPIYIPIMSNLLNKYVSQLPLLNHLCLINYLIAKPTETYPANNKLYSVSVVIPARNEKGNIENAVKRTPLMGKNTEIIFIEGHSKDNTLKEIGRVHAKYSPNKNLRFAVQKGTGKGDAVRLGFDMAKGDILMILDADLTVPPEDLIKFYNAIAEGKGEFINGSRLVYPMEKEAMQTLNVFGNKFFSIMFSWLLGQTIKDTLCGTKVLFKKDYERIKKNRKFFGDFDPFGDFDLLFGSAKLNLKILELPIRYKAREYGSTNISRFKHGLLLLKMVFFAMKKIKFI